MVLSGHMAHPLPFAFRDTLRSSSDFLISDFDVRLIPYQDDFDDDFDTKTDSKLSNVLSRQTRRP